MASILPAAVIGSSAIGAIGSSSAASQQEQAANQASQVQLQMFNQTQANEQPYMQGGFNALQALLYGEGLPGTTAQAPGSAPAGGAPGQTIQLPGGGSYTIPGTPGATAPGTPAPQITGGLGFGSLDKPFNPADLANTPGYKFQLQQGLDALQNSASATGGLGGGNTLKALMGYGQGLASETYQQQLQDYMAQQQQSFNQLDTLAGSGQNAAANLGAIGSQVAGNIGSNIIGAGNAAAAGTVGVTNALTGGIGDLSSNYLLSSILGQGGLGGGSVFGGGGGGYSTVPLGG